MVQWLALLLHIYESCHLNIGSEASYPSSQILRCILKHKMTAAYNILSNTSFTNYNII